MPLRIVFTDGAAAQGHLAALGCSESFWSWHAVDDFDYLCGFAARAARGFPGHITDTT